MDPTDRVITNNYCIYLVSVGPGLQQWQLPLLSAKSKMAAQNGRQSPVMSLKTGLSRHKWL